jgi:SAM-dependent methyltransferase
MGEGKLVQYYAERALEYERIYEKAERQADLRKIRHAIETEFAGKHVLEVACGTGYWTEVLAKSAAAVYASDINEEVIEIARAKPAISKNPKISFVQSDAYTLNGVPRSSACLIAFWWSHIPRERLISFLDVVHSKLERSATVMIIDNRFVTASSTPIDRRDDQGNTYQTRTLANGSRYEVLKNFPSETELKRAAAPFTDSPTLEWLEYYWILRYDMHKQ